MFIKEEREVCVVSLVPLGGKPKDAVELLFPYTPTQLVLESLILAGYTVTLSMEYRSVNIRVKDGKDGTVAKATRSPRKTKATKKAKAEVVSTTDDADFAPDVEVGDTIVIED